MTEREQYDFYTAALRDGEIEREKQIREMAAKAVDYVDSNIGSLGMQFGWESNVMESMRNFQADSLVSPMTVRMIDVRVSPCIRDRFARIIVAEEIIRKQLGDIP